MATAREIFEREKAKAGAVSGLKNIEKAVRESTSRRKEDAPRSVIGTSVTTSRDDSGRKVTREFDPSTGRTTVSANDAELQQAALLAQQEAQERLLEAQRRGNIEALRGAEKTALGATGRQREQTAEEAFGQRRGIKTQAQQSARSFSEFLAGRGLGRSGAAAQGQIAQNVALQEGLGQARAQETSRLADIGQRETDIRTQTAAGVAQAGQQAEAQRAQLEIARLQQEAEQQRAFDQLSAQRQFEAQQAEQNQAIQLAEEQRAQDFKREIFNLENDAKVARDQLDFERENEILQTKAELEAQLINLRESFGGSGGGGGISTSQQRLAFNDQVDAGISGLDALISRSGGVDQFGNPTAPTRSQQEAIIVQYLRDLRNQGVDDAVLEQIAVSSGIANTGRFTEQPQDIFGGGVPLPTFGR